MANEGPSKSVNFVRPFTVSRYEIMRSEYAAFIKETRHQSKATCSAAGQPQAAYDWERPGIAQSPRDPVVCVSWDDGIAYTDWLSRKTKRTYRLLSEAEWEYAARASTITPYWQGNTLAKKDGNFAGERNGTAEAGASEANKFGLFDVSGNVWELTEDCWSDSLALVPPGGSAVRSGGDCQRRAIRGGGWNSPAVDLRLANRRPIGSGEASNTVGLRVAREIQ